MHKLPAFQFYPGDWLKDPAVRACSIESRGLWIDMLCLMHESPRRGYLQHETGKAVTAEQLARMTGCSTDSTSTMLRELEDAGVFSRSEHGTIYSRRIVRDEHKRNLCSEAGKKGGGNPTFRGHPKGPPKGGPNPSSSSSISSSESKPPAAAQPTPAGGSRSSLSWSEADGWQGVTDSDRAAWLAAFPACDIDRQLARMGQWLLANPAKARKSNWRKFVTNWLSRSQDKGGDVASNRPTQGTVFESDADRALRLYREQQGVQQ